LEIEALGGGTRRPPGFDIFRWPQVPGLVVRFKLALETNNILNSFSALPVGKSRMSDCGGLAGCIYQQLIGPMDSIEIYPTLVKVNLYKHDLLSMAS